jgi:hypothetical protein
MFGIRTLYRLLEKQGIIKERCWPMAGCEYVPGPVDVRKLEAKVDLLMKKQDLELVKVKEHYELRERE